MILEGSPNETRKTIEERICEIDLEWKAERVIDGDTDTDTEFYYTLAAISRIAE